MLDMFIECIQRRATNQQESREIRNEKLTEFYNDAALILKQAMQPGSESPSAIIFSNDRDRQAD